MQASSVARLGDLIVAMDFEAARIKMVDNQIRTTDVTAFDILRAFLTVPREIFVPQSQRELAYIGADIPLGHGRMLMQASPAAKLIQLAGVRPGDTVLDVGCGTGYQAAILSRLASRVVALESQPELAAEARRLSVADPAIAVVQGPLPAGRAAEAPYDVILVEGAVAEMPGAFTEQLAEGGRLVLVQGLGNAASARLYVKDDGVVSSRFGFNCSLRPLPGFERAEQFRF